MGKGGHRAWQLPAAASFPVLVKAPGVPHEEETLVLQLWATAKSNQGKLPKEGLGVGF